MIDIPNIKTVLLCFILQINDNVDTTDTFHVTINLLHCFGRLYCPPASAYWTIWMLDCSKCHAESHSDLSFSFTRLLIFPSHLSNFPNVKIQSWTLHCCVDPLCCSGCFHQRERLQPSLSAACRITCSSLTFWRVPVIDMAKHRLFSALSLSFCISPFQILKP